MMLELDVKVNDQNWNESLEGMASAERPKS